MPVTLREGTIGRKKTSLLVLPGPRAVSAEHKIGIAIPQHPPSKHALAGITMGRPAKRKPDKTDLTMTNSRLTAQTGRQQRQELPEPNNLIMRPPEEWWSRTGSNRRHPACKAGALPAELRPQFLRTLDQWWAWEDLNLRPHAYQARALTN